MHSGKGLALGRQPTQLAFCKTTTPRLKRIPTPGRPVCEFSSARFAVQPTLDAELKEKSREYRRTVFSHDSWIAHRSTERYVRHMQGMLTSRMVRGLARPLLYVTSVATAVALYESAREAGLLPLMFPDIELNSKEPFTLTSFALSLLLVFRTNSSYSRWLDARKTWGLVLNRSRDLVRQGLAWIPEDRAQHREMLCRWVPAFSRVLMCHVRRHGDLVRELQGVLLPHELQEVLLAQHRPNYVLQVLAQLVKTSHVSEMEALRMDENITLFEDCLGTCERILKTPIPLSYTRHTSRFMMIWLTLLPFELWGSCGWTAIPLSSLIAFLLLGIEEIGVSIEEPFSILALEAICETALSNVRELQTYHDTALASSPNGTGSPRQPLPAGRLVALTTKSGQQAGGLPMNSTLAAPNAEAGASLESMPTAAGNGRWAGEGLHKK